MRKRQSLPDSTCERLVLITDRTLPDPDRPPIASSLPPEIARRIEEADREAALTYADAEELVYQIRRTTRLFDPSVGDAPEVGTLSAAGS